MQSIIAIIILSLLMIIQDNFKSSQLKYSRVKQSYQHQEKFVVDLLKTNLIKPNDFTIFLRAFKKEQDLEVWAKSGNEEEYKLIRTYKFCMLSGTLGPKRKQGDMQVPEGFYQIDRFNPASNFHLSLGINYPNTSDKILSKGKDPGGDIFIHGNCVSIGCIPITDTLIEELYVMTVEARNNGQKEIPVHIFPYRFSKASEPNKVHEKFWKTLEPGFWYFEKNKNLPTVIILDNGDYSISE